MDLNLQHSIFSDPKPFHRIALLYAVALALSMCGGLPVHAEARQATPPTLIDRAV
ncbi:MAG TPA: hypothetical protein VGO70_04375 [Arsenicitalea sp.]|jgi:hypothetical protein|nr:hypothetical protein [Arsenicitalea sp.]